MPNYARLHEMISHRVAFEFETGAKIIGYIAWCKPGLGQGPVQLVRLSKAEIIDDKGRIMETHEEYSLVPNVLANFNLAEGPSARGQERT